MKAAEGIQLILATGIVALAIIAAYQDKWELVGAVVTGAFAILQPILRKEQPPDESPIATTGIIRP